MVDGDSHEACTRRIEAGGDQFIAGEATAKAEAAVVARCWAVDNGPKWAFDWTWCDLLCADLAGSLAALFAGGVVKECLHTLVPSLPEVVVGNHVVFAHHETERKTITAERGAPQISKLFAWICGLSCFIDFCPIWQMRIVDVELPSDFVVW